MHLRAGLQPGSADHLRPPTLPDPQLPFTQQPRACLLFPLGHAAEKHQPGVALRSLFPKLPRPLLVFF